MIQGPETLTLSSLIGDVLSVLITFHFTSRMLLFPDYFQLHWFLFSDCSYKCETELLEVDNVCACLASDGVYDAQNHSFSWRRCLRWIRFARGHYYRGQNRHTSQSSGYLSRILVGDSSFWLLFMSVWLICMCHFICRRTIINSSLISDNCRGWPDNHRWE